MIEAGEILIPVATPNPLNGSHRHWSAVARQRKRIRKTVCEWLYFAARPDRPELPATVRLTRLSSGQLDDDNLLAALKPVRDAVADWLDVDDADARIRWQYAQRSTQRGKQAVAIRFLAKKRPAPKRGFTRQAV